jgi:hypothetical protein
MREIKLPVTPITEDTFIRQGWKKHSAIDFMGDDMNSKKSDEDDDDDESGPFFWILPIPKDRTDQHAPVLVSNMTDELGALKEFGLKPGQFFVEIMDMDGLGLCVNEEELEVLYGALTGENINK